MPPDGPDSGWDLVTRQDDAAAIIGTVVNLDPEKVYARSELAEAADVPLKTLYLADTLEELVDVGILDRVDEEGDDSETKFRVDEESEVLMAARAFDEAFLDHRRA